MYKRQVLCADTDRLGGRGFSIGHDDRGVHILSGKSGRRDRYAVVVVAQDRTVLGLTPYGQAVLRVETEQSDRRQRFLSCLGHRGRIEKGAGGVRFIGKRYGDLLDVYKRQPLERVSRPYRYADKAFSEQETAYWMQYCIGRSTLDRYRVVSILSLIHISFRLVVQRGEDSSL